MGRRRRREKPSESGSSSSFALVEMVTEENLTSKAIPSFLDDAKPAGQIVDVNHRTEGSVLNFSIKDAINVGEASFEETHDELVRLVIEFGFQNDYLKAQIGSISSQFHKPVYSKESDYGQDGEASGQLHGLSEKIKCLNKEIQEQRETQKAAEDALEHLRAAYSEADGKVQELSAKLTEAQDRMQQEIKERDDKYVELDSKFGRLHKRAKQRIQEIQKERDDLEGRLLDVNAKAAQAINQQTVAQQDLERARQQASEALRSMDVERQQLRTANNKLRDSIDEMRRTLEVKANALEGLQQSVFEKEQMLEETRRSLLTVEENKQATILELTAKHQKQLESMEEQLADAVSERSKAAETISSLQMVLIEKDSKLAELDAASTGEAVRLGAALEEARAELIHLKAMHEEERQSWETANEALKTRLEASESACARSEIEAAKTRSQLELELSMQKQLLNTRDTELMSAKTEIHRLENEFSSYKIRAHALLQKKDAELAEAKDSEIIRAQEEAIKEAETEIAAALAERDKAIHDLQDALRNHKKEINARDVAFYDAEQQIQKLSRKLDSAIAHYMSEKEAWQKNLESTEETWRVKYGMLEAQKSVHIDDDLEKAFKELRIRHEKLKEEHDSFRDVADRAIEEKENEIAKLTEENNSLNRALELRPSVDHHDRQRSASIKPDAQILSVAAAEQQIVFLAKQQAQREEELAQSQRHILVLQDEIEELEHEIRLHSQQEMVLKEELRNMERSEKREGIDMTYLKNVILKLLETGEVEALLPVVGTLLQFSPEEVRKCQQAYHSNDPLSPAAVADSVPTPRSLFSRFSFS